MSVKRRNFWTMLLLSIITCGIYGIYWWWCFTKDMNKVCEGRSSEKPSPNYLVVILLSIVTCTIYFYIWMYKQGNRLADAADSYNVPNQTTGTSLLMWYLFGAILCGLGPFIAVAQWIGLFNKVADAYNQQFPDGGYPGGGLPAETGPSDGGIGAFAQKMEQGAGNIADKIQGSKGFTNLKKAVGDKVPAFQKNNQQYRNLLTSKHRGMANGNVRSANTAELVHSEAPVILTKVQIAELGQNGNVSLFLGFQNTADRNIAAIYLDVVCYNMLKEQIGVLTDVCYIDLNVGKGQIFETPAPIALPDNSIRKCDIIIRHVVYTDESIWSYEGSEVFVQVDEQQLLNLPDGLNDEFKRQMKQIVPDVNYGFTPEDRGNFWFCACGQLNPQNAGNCIACGADKASEFRLMDMTYLSAQRDAYMEEMRAAREEAERQEAERRAREEEVKAQRIAERNQKIEETQQKAKNAFNAFKQKGEETLKGAGVMKSSGLTCPNCGKPYQPGDKFCMGCGAHLDQPVINAAQPSAPQSGVKICEKCGMENDADSKFCMGCGNPLGAAAPAYQASQAEQARPAQPQQPVPPMQPQQQPQQNFSSPAPEEDQDELKTVVLTPEMAAQMAAAKQSAAEAPQNPGPVQAGGKVICPACGYENEPGAMFCMGCGSRIDQ